MTLSTLQLVGAIVVLFLLACLTSGPGRGNRPNGYNQRQFSNMGMGGMQYPAPTMRRSNPLSKIIWLVVLVVVGYILLTLYAPGVLHSIQSSVHSLSTPASHSSLQSGSESIVGSPTVTADLMDRVLERAGSPAPHTFGETLYTLGIQYHIDPVFPLAFFHHESTFGLKGVAAVTHGLGNVRCTSGWACDPSGGYRAYPTWIIGAEDWFEVMQHVYVEHGLTTVSKIIPVYAPAADRNNEPAYIRAVMDDVAHWRSGQV